MRHEALTLKVMSNNKLISVWRTFFVSRLLLLSVMKSLTIITEYLYCNIFQTATSTGSTAVGRLKLKDQGWMELKERSSSVIVKRSQTV